MSRKQFAVIGDPIAHSLSPVMHNAGFAALGLDQQGFSYTRFQVNEAAFPEFFATTAQNLAGLSVTMPCKFAALKAATAVTARAELIGSANTLVRLEDGSWRADNTDTLGSLGALTSLGFTPGSVKQGLIIGAGGTALPALWALAQLGATKVTVLNRSARFTLLSELAAKLQVELDPVLFEQVEDAQLPQLVQQHEALVSTVPSAALTGKEDLLAQIPTLDVIYHPWPTPLVAACAAKEIPAVGGAVMLAEQGYAQFEQFTGQPAPKEAMWAALSAALPR